MKNHILLILVLILLSSCASKSDLNRLEERFDSAVATQDTIVMEQIHHASALEVLYGYIKNNNDISRQNNGLIFQFHEHDIEWTDMVPQED